MACDCDGLNNRLRNYEDRLRRLERASNSGGSGANNQNNDDLIERVFRDERWLCNVRVLKKIILGSR